MRINVKSTKSKQNYACFLVCLKIRERGGVAKIKL